jgi:hypothetical protein
MVAWKLKQACKLKTNDQPDELQTVSETHPWHDLQYRGKTDNPSAECGGL